jgi:hypothetical protein
MVAVTRKSYGSRDPGRAYGSRDPELLYAAQGRALCHECNAKVKADGVGKYMCQKCHAVIDGEPLRFRGEVYHPYHFNCTGILIIIATIC